MTKSHTLLFSVAAIGSIAIGRPADAQNCIQLRGQAYSQNFNSLPASGTSLSSATLPAGWSFVEIGSGGNTLYAADDGSSATSNTYSYGNGTQSDRALGEITSLTVRPACGVCFLNNTGFTIPSLYVSYTGEQWRVGQEDDVNDRLDFQYSKTATSVGDSTAQWLNVDALDFISPTTTGVGAKNGNSSANRTAFAPTTITPAGGIPVGGAVFLRWLSIDIAGNDDGLAIDDFSLSYSPSADFNLDGLVNGADLLALQRGYGTTSGASVAIGDANRDGAVNASDFAIWRAQFGAATAATGAALDGATTPEPAAAILVSMAVICCAAWLRKWRRSVAAILVAWLVASGGMAPAQNVSLSLNVFPASNANPNSGGAWTLVAKTDWANGIAGIDAFLNGINAAGVVYGTGINAATFGGAPFVTSGTPNELVYFQDLSLGGVVVGVGRPAFSPGVDPLGSTTWDHATRIATGTYASTAPTFYANSGSRVTAANVLSTNSPPFTHASAAVTTAVTRLALSGDYNLDGKVDAADYVVWRNSLGSSTMLGNDPTPGVGSDDYNRWRANLGTTLSSGSSLTEAPVPEPSSVGLWMLALAALTPPAPGRRGFTVRHFGARICRGCR